MRAPRTLLVLLLFGLCASAGTYTLRWGDTLGGVARRFGVSTGALAAANGIGDPNRVREGQVLRIPDAGGRASSASAGGVHRVAAGETLGAIARRHGTTVSRLVQLNGLRDPNRIRVGQVLRLAAPQWVCPVQGRVRFVSVFGDPRGGGRRHAGVDLMAPTGTPVVANTSGFFKRSSNRLGGHAYYLEGDDGIVYYGAHLSEYVGGTRYVRLGEAIGRVGSSGNAAGTVPHLHFEAMPGGGDPVDPMPRLARACPTS